MLPITILILTGDYSVTFIKIIGEIQYNCIRREIRIMKQLFFKDIFLLNLRKTTKIINSVEQEFWE